MALGVNHHPDTIALRVVTMDLPPSYRIQVTV